MKLSDLHDDELIVLLGALKMVSWADGLLSDAESAALRKIIERIGPRAKKVLPRTAEVITGQAALAEWALRVERPEARVLIFDLCTQVARADGIDPTELAVLDWLDEVWQGA
jgi:tellurite resistance protein